MLNINELNFQCTESQFQKALVIQENVSPRGEEYSRTLDDYAKVLRETNQIEKAGEIELRAAIVRNPSWLFPSTPDLDDKVVAFAYPSYRSFHGSVVDAMGSYSSREAPEDMEFIKLNVNHLPDFNETLIPLFSLGIQYGRLSIPANGSKTFKVNVRAGSTFSISIFRDKKDYNLVLLDENNKEVKALTDQETVLRVDSEKAAIYSLKLSNKSASQIDYVIKLVNFGINP